MTLQPIRLAHKPDIPVDSGGDKKWPPFLSAWGRWVDAGLHDLLYEGLFLLVLLSCIAGLTLLSLPAWVGVQARRAVQSLMR